MTPPTTARTATRTLAQQADQAEQAVRALIHRTRPAVGEPTDPGQAAEVLAALAALTGMLPQLLDQLTGALLAQHQAGRLGLDEDAPQPDPRHAVHATAAALAHAAGCARRAGHALDTAHQHAAHLRTVPRDSVTRDGVTPDDVTDDGDRGCRR